eukprot:CAMPEP_0176306040 /NCGR_PEP_ID=MMETSP0121_2-20121125/63271_1 /TAXON_ID=160619 /ORGANISM="Kryptoperidinium foliaceum, Strain CCMP 1326" /LENGTH=83 /DNA_ID=CAMNT_0017647725 /DNA_START=41 /DNA_END=292 /DNA_ORIENTATION=-
MEGVASGASTPDFLRERSRAELLPREGSQWSAEGAETPKELEFTSSLLNSKLLVEKLYFVDGLGIATSAGEPVEAGRNKLPGG